MFLIAKKIISIASIYGKKRLLFFFLLMLFQALLAICAAASVAPMLSIGLSESKELELLGIHLDFTEVIVLFILAQLLLFISNVTLEYLYSKYMSNFSAWLRVFLLNEIMSKPYSYFTKNDSSVIQLTVNGYGAQFGMRLKNLLDMLSKIILILGFLSAAFFSSPTLTSFMAVIALVYYVFIVKLFKKLRAVISNDLRSNHDKLQSYSMQTIQGAKFLRISRKESIFLEQYKEAASSVSKNEIIPAALVNVPKSILEFFLMFGLACYFFFLYINGNVLSEFSNTGVLVFVAFKTFPLAQAVFANYSELATGGYIVDKVAEELAESNKSQEVQHSVSELKLNSNIETKGLEFSYGEDLATIRYPDIKINAGETVGIQGPSGCGKSTLIDLILGLYTPTAGNILVDGKVVKESDLKGLYSQIGYVGQDSYLLNLSVAENIALEKPENINLEKIKKATKLAQIDDFIRALPEGYDSMIGDRGVRLSGGQRQRIAIARAIYNNPSIILLDEATSALDHETESKIMDTIYSLPKEITVIMIAHRLSTLERADKVFKLEVLN